MSANAFALLQLLAHVYLRNGDPERAVVLFAALYQLRPQDVATNHALAWAYIEAGQPGPALSILDELAHCDAQALGMLLRARALARLGHDADAQGLMRMFLNARAAQRMAQ